MCCGCSLFSSLLFLSLSPLPVEATGCLRLVSFRGAASVLRDAVSASGWSEGRKRGTAIQTWPGVAHSNDIPLSTHAAGLRRLAAPLAADGVMQSFGVKLTCITPCTHNRNTHALCLPPRSPTQSQPLLHSALCASCVQPCPPRRAACRMRRPCRPHSQRRHGVICIVGSSDS